MGIWLFWLQAVIVCLSLGTGSTVHCLLRDCWLVLGDNNNNYTGVCNRLWRLWRRRASHASHTHTRSTDHGYKVQLLLLVFLFLYTVEARQARGRPQIVNV